MTIVLPLRYAFSYCLSTKQTAFLLPLENPFSEWACDITQVKKRWECLVGEITFLAKLAYSTIFHERYFFKQPESVPYLYIPVDGFYRYECNMSLPAKTLSVETHAHPPRLHCVIHHIYINCWFPVYRWSVMEIQVTSISPQYLEMWGGGFLVTCIYITDHL